MRVSDIYVYLLILQCLTEGIETHSSVLAWRIPHTEKPGGLQAMALQRATNTFIFFQATLRRRSPRKRVGREEPRENQCFGAQVKSCKRD